MSHAAREPSPALLNTFLEDARQNLSALRAVYGADSQPYQSLVRRYCDVARALGGELALADLLTPLDSSIDATDGQHT